jgi:hypothetical protein
MRVALWWLWLGCAGTEPAGTDASDDSDSPAVDDSDPVVPEDCLGPQPPAAMPAAQPAEPVFGVEALSPTEALCVVVEDLDGDGATDLLWVEDLQPPVVEVRWGGGGEASLALPAVPSWDRFHYGACATVDADGDGRLELVVAHTEGGGLVTFGLDRTLTWTADRLTWPASRGDADWRVIQLTTVDLDHRPPLDLIVGVGGRLADECATSTGDTDDHYEADPSELVPVMCLVGEEGGRWAPDDGSWCPGPAAESVAPHQTAIADLDEDGNLDAFFALDFAKNEVRFGRPEGGFGAAEASTGLEVYDHAMGAAIADFDGDGRRDVYVTDIGADDLYRGVACRQWFDATASLGLPALTGGTITWGVNTIDLDRNGATDLVTVASVDLGAAGFDRPLCDVESWGVGFGPVIVLLNDGLGGFTRHDVPLHADQPGYLQIVRQAWGDADGDGDADLLVSTRYGVSLLRGQLPPVGHWLRVRPEWADGAPAVGAKVSVTTSGVQRRELWPDGGTSGPSELTADFGVQAGQVTVGVEFPDGEAVVIDGVVVDQLLRVRHP